MLTDGFGHASFPALSGSCPTDIAIKMNGDRASYLLPQAAAVLSRDNGCEPACHGGLDGVHFILVCLTAGLHFSCLSESVLNGTLGLSQQHA